MQHVSDRHRSLAETNKWDSPLNVVNRNRLPCGGTCFRCSSVSKHWRANSTLRLARVLTSVLEFRGFEIFLVGKFRRLEVITFWTLGIQGFDLRADWERLKFWIWPSWIVEICCFASWGFHFQAPGCVYVSFCRVPQFLAAWSALSSVYVIVPWTRWRQTFVGRFDLSILGRSSWGADCAPVFQTWAAWPYSIDKLWGGGAPFAVSPRDPIWEQTYFTGVGKITTIRGWSSSLPKDILVGRFASTAKLCSNCEWKCPIEPPLADGALWKPTFPRETVRDLHFGIVQCREGDNQHICW